MNVNELFKRAAMVGIQRITLAIDPRQQGKPTVMADQFIQSAGNMSSCQHQISAATHEAACLTLLERARLLAVTPVPADRTLEIIEPDGNSQ